MPVALPLSRAYVEKSTSAGSAGLPAHFRGEGVWRRPGRDRGTGETGPRMESSSRQ